MDDPVVEELTAAYEGGEIMQERYEELLRHRYGSMFRRFVLDRNEDMTGVSGTGVVAEGVEFSDGTCVMRWVTQWRSTVFYEQGLEAVIRIHGHDGRTVVRFLDGPSAGVPRDHHEH